MIKIRNNVLFDEKGNGKYRHGFTLDKEHEEILAALMLKENRPLSDAIARALDVHFAMYKTAKRDEMMAKVRKVIEGAAADQ